MITDPSGCGFAIRVWVTATILRLHPPSAALLFYAEMLVFF